MLPPPPCHGQSAQQAHRTEDRGRCAHRYVVGAVEERVRQVPASAREQDERAADTRTQHAADGAHEDGAHALLAQAEAMLEGATRYTIQVVRERVAHIRWRVSRLNPAAYGDRSELRVSGTITHKHQLSDEAPGWIKERLSAPSPTTSSVIDITPDTSDPETQH